MNTIKITFGIAALASAVFANGYSAAPVPSDIYSSVAPVYSAAPIPSDYITSSVEESSVESYVTESQSEETPAYSAESPVYSESSAEESSVEEYTTSEETP
ncbi:hypothetical protein LPJ62_005933, partial [Coemansia sp. RSA 2167]